MSNDPGRIYHLALRELHAAAGGRFGVRHGWSLPLDYGDGQAEYEALRSRAAAFERSQRSRFLVSGTDALDVLRTVFAGNVEELEEGRAMRTLALDEHGNIMDLVLVARTGGIAYLVTGEPTQRDDTLARLQAAAEEGYDVRIDDRTESTCLVGLAGPAAAEVAREHLSDALPARLQTLHAVTFEFHGFRTLAVRASDTGEDGFELMLAPAVAQHVFETLAAAGARLAGATALEAARIEACIPAFDPDLLPGLSAAEADLDVILDVPPGRTGRTLAAMLLDGSEPLPPGTPLTRDGVPRGELRSCAWSPGLNATIGLGIISSRESAPGQAYIASGRRAVVAAKPLLRRRSL